MLHLLCLSNTSLFILVALGAMVCPRVYPFAQSALLASGHYNESSVWFNASNFWYTTITGLTKYCTETWYLGHCLGSC